MVAQTPPAVVLCQEFSGVCFSTPHFKMTGLLSVFSLLSVQALKKKENSQGGIVEEEDPGGPRVKQTDGVELSSHGDSESSITER